MGCTVFINNFCGALKPTLAQSRCYYVIFWLPLSLSRDDGIYNWTSPYHGVQHNHSWYLSQPPQPAVVFSFRTRAFFCTENAKFWPLLTNLGYFVASLRTFWCTFTRLNNAVVTQNCQISGMCTYWIFWQWSKISYIHYNMSWDVKVCCLLANVFVKQLGQISGIWYLRLLLQNMICKYFY